MVRQCSSFEQRPGNAETCDDDVQQYCQQALTGPRAGVWGIGVAGRCLSKTLAQGQYMAQGCKSLVLAAAPKVGLHASRMSSLDMHLLCLLALANLPVLLPSLPIKAVALSRFCMSIEAN